jgi:hypothetical protein
MEWEALICIWRNKNLYGQAFNIGPTKTYKAFKAIYLSYARAD